MDFRRILERFLAIFSWIFRSFTENRDLVKNSCFSYGKLLFFKVRALKKQHEMHQKSMQNLKKKRNTKKVLKKYSWEGLGAPFGEGVVLHLAGVWDGLGRLVGTLGHSWVAFWTF